MANLHPAADNFHAIPTGTATNYTLPNPGGRYLLVAIGEFCYIADGGLAATVDGKGMYMPVGVLVGPIKLSGEFLSVIGSTGTGILYVIEASERDRA